MSFKYLEFDSNFRDRNEYPDPASFVIQISQTITDRFSSLDPVCDSSPILVYNASFVEGTYDQTTIDGITVLGTAPGLLGADIFQIVSHPVIIPPGDVFSLPFNFYVNYTLGVDYGGGVIVEKLITFSVTSDPHSASVGVNSLFPSSTTTFYIKNTFGVKIINNITLVNQTSFFGGVLCDLATEPGHTNPAKSLRQVRDFYVGASITITNGGIITTRRITEYKPLNLLNGIIKVDSPLPDSVIGLTNFHIDNPTPIDTLTSNSVIKIFIPGSNDNVSETQKEQTYGLGGDNYYIGYYLQIDYLGIPKIIDFDKNTRLATLSTPTYTPGRSYTIRKQLPFFTTVAGPDFGPSVITMSPYFFDPLTMTNYTLSSTNDFYVGSFLRIPTGGVIPPYQAPYNEERRIVKYNGSTYTFTVSPPFSKSLFGLIYNCEIEQFTRDSCQQFNFTGLNLSQHVENYEIKLLNLVLPNTLLASGRGGRAIFYPYFYVELRQLSISTSQSLNVISSNNLNSYRMLFRAVVNDTVKPDFSPFIKIDGDGMTHTLRIQPNDSFRFSVYHPNGELFKTVIEDTRNPKAPNPLAQISACFSFKKK